MSGADEGASPLGTGDISRRTLLGTTSVVGLLASLGLLDLLNSYPAFGSPHWRHPFTFPAVIGDGWRPSHRPNHNAVDYGYGGVTNNTDIHAVASGTVIAKVSTLGGSHGYSITLGHANGWTSHYAHMIAPTWLSVGDPIAPSEHIGDVGNTGESSGAHLHIELKHNGAFQDPTLYIHHTVAPLAQPGVPEFQANGDSDMLMIRKGSPGAYEWALFGPGFWYEIPDPGGSGIANGMILQITGGNTSISAPAVTPAVWDAIKAAALRVQDVRTVP